MGDAAVEILSRPSSAVSGRCLLDAEVLASSGVTDLATYEGGEDPEADLFVDPVRRDRATEREAR